MTNSWRSFALEGVAVAAMALAGCGGPGDGSVEFAEGAAAYEVRDFARAERGFSASLALAPDSVDALLMLARTELELGKIDEAGEALRRARELAGGDSDVRLLSAQAAYHARDYESARRIFLQVANDGELSAGVRAEGWAGLGVVEMSDINGSASLSARDVARTAFLRAIKLDGRNASARYHLGVLYMNAFGYNESALDQFEIFVRLEKAADKRVQDVQRKTIPSVREAIASAAARRDGVSKRDSAASAAALKKAEEAWKKGTYKTARLRYSEAFEADVLSFPAALGLARSWLKSDTTKSGLQESAKYYRLASSLRPSSKETAMAAGDLAYKLGNYVSAVAAYSHAVAASPYDITAVDGLIRGLQKSGNQKSAAVYQRYRDWLPARKR